jgi:hypothetical protein
VAHPAAAQASAVTVAGGAVEVSIDVVSLGLVNITSLDVGSVT